MQYIFEQWSLQQGNMSKIMTVTLGGGCEDRKELQLVCSGYAYTMEGDSDEEIIRNYHVPMKNQTHTCFFM